MQESEEHALLVLLVCYEINSKNSFFITPRKGFPRLADAKVHTFPFPAKLFGKYFHVICKIFGFVDKTKTHIP